MNVVTEGDISDTQNGTTGPNPKKYPPTAHTLYTELLNDNNNTMFTPQK